MGCTTATYLSKDIATKLNVEIENMKNMHTLEYHKTQYKYPKSVLLGGSPGNNSVNVVAIRIIDVAQSAIACDAIRLLVNFWCECILATTIHTTRLPRKPIIPIKILSDARKISAAVFGANLCPSVGLVVEEVIIKSKSIVDVIIFS